MTFEDFFMGLGWKGKLTVSALLILPILGIGNVAVGAVHDNNIAFNQWANRHGVTPCPFIWSSGPVNATALQNCHDTSITHRYNSTITFVRDYQVECDTWFNRAACPKENIAFETDSRLNQTMTFSCQFYHLGDKVIADETFAWHDFNNATDTWSIEGSPC